MIVGGMNLLRTVKKDVAYHLILPDICAMVMFGDCFPHHPGLGSLTNFHLFPVGLKHGTRLTNWQVHPWGKAHHSLVKHWLRGRALRVVEMVLCPARSLLRADTTDHIQGDESFSRLSRDPDTGSCPTHIAQVLRFLWHSFSKRKTCLCSLCYF